jgi:hypothetical protein
MRGDAVSGEGLGARPGGPPPHEPPPGEPLRAALLKSAADQAVAEAEAEICLSWARELDRAREAADHGLAVAEAACAAARTQVKTEEAAGRLRAMTRAMRALEGAEAARRRGAAAAVTLREAITKERAALAEAADARAHVTIANTARVDTAWQAFLADGRELGGGGRGDGNGRSDLGERGNGGSSSSGDDGPWRPPSGSEN